MQIGVGYELTYSVPQPTPMLLTVNIHYSRASDLIEPDHLVTRPGLHSIHIIRFGPIEVLYGSQQQSAHRAVMLLANAFEHRHVLGCLTRLDSSFDFVRDDPTPAQRESALDDERQAHDRGQTQ